LIGTERARDAIEHFENVRGLAEAIRGLGNTDVSEDPDAAAEHFDALFQYAGALGEEIPGQHLLGPYMEFVKELGKENFFSKMRETFEGGMGATDAAVSQEAQNELIYGGDPRELQ